MENAFQFIDSCVDWIRDWFEKNGKGCNAIIGLSGGKDSTVAAAIVARAIGSDRVYGVGMPDFGQKYNDADKIAEHLGINFLKVPIHSGVIVQTMAANGLQVSEQTEQNIPPRLRMTTLYAVAQSINGRVVGTCNASELYIGYATRYGDLASDFEPLAGLTCRQVVKVGKALGIPDKWVEKVPDDGLPNSEPDDEKFKRWGFSYALLDEYLENGTCGDEVIDKIIEERHKSQIFKMGLGTMFGYNQGDIHAGSSI